MEGERPPESEVAQELRKAIWSALRAMEKDLPGGSTRSTLALLMAGKMSSRTFPEKAMENLREKLKDILEAFGLDRGEERPDDAEQISDVRLLQALKRAFEDPDHDFCEWWARGVWLGSPERQIGRVIATNSS